MEDKIKDTDKILGMNRTMFFVIIILLCILSLSIGIYAQVFYRYSDTDPFMLGIGIGRTQSAAEITKLKNEFNNIFTNNLTGQTTLQNINKIDDNGDIVTIMETVTERDEENYNIEAHLPKLNINANEASKINSEIEDKFLSKIDEIMDSKKEYTDYSVSFRAYINGELLSLIIKENLYEGKVQSSKITTYNYNLKGNKRATIMEIADSKGYNINELQREINAEMKKLNAKDEELKSQYTEVKLRDLSNDMYKFENTENFIVDNDGYLYLIYAYGNTDNTNKIDLVIFK